MHARPPFPYLVTRSARWPTSTLCDPAASRSEALDMERARRPRAGYRAATISRSEFSLTPDFRLFDSAIPLSAILGASRWLLRFHLTHIAGSAKPSSSPPTPDIFFRLRLERSINCTATQTQHIWRFPNRRRIGRRTAIGAENLDAFSASPSLCWRDFI